MINLIYIPSHHFIVPCLLIENFYKNQGEQVYLMMSDHMINRINHINLLPNSLIINDGDLSKRFSGVTDQDFNFVFMHHDCAQTKIESILHQIVEISDKIHVSYYPDGYTNAFCGKELIKDIQREFSSYNINNKHAFSFDTVNPSLGKLMPNFQHENLDSRLLKSIFKENEQFKIINQKVLNIISTSRKDNQPIIFVILRPWCTENFHSGYYHFGEGEKSLAKIIVEIIDFALQDINESPLMVIKGDSREKVFLGNVSELLQDFYPNLAIIDITDKIHNLMTFDSIFFEVVESIDQKVSLISLDSTTPLPFLGAELKHISYIGASYDTVLNLKPESKQLKYIYDVKLHNLLSYTKNLKNTSIEISNLVKGLYKLSLEK